VNRAHSGPFGLVNSEEGYQNLRRFLFGNVAFRVRLRFGRVTGRLPHTDARDVLDHLLIGVGVAIRGVPGWLDLRSERELTAEELALEPAHPEGYRLKGEQDPTLYTGYLFAMRENRREHRAAASDRFSRWLMELAIRPHYRRAGRRGTSRFEGDSFLNDRIEFALGDENASKPFVYRWHQHTSTMQEPQEEAPPAGVTGRFVVPMPPAAARYLEDVALVVDISDWD
jgi:hypothetical protein